MSLPDATNVLCPAPLQVRFYSDDAALSFVRREFPEYFEAYLSLPKDVERADFFRCACVCGSGVLCLQPGTAMGAPVAGGSGTLGQHPCGCREAL